MSHWLSSLWEPSWRSFSYYNLYRLALAAVSLLALLFAQPWADPFHLTRAAAPPGLLIIYLGLVILGLIASVRWQRHFDQQLTLQFSVDALIFGILMYHAGGVSSGMGILLLVSLTAASLVGRGRLVLFYAAEATLFVLGQQILNVLRGESDPVSLVQAGLLSAGLFGTAILARLLGQRVMFNEDLARRRGIALENQQRINQRVLERMQDGVLVVAPSGDIVRCNPVAAMMLGLPDSGAPLALAALAPALFAACFRWRVGEGEEAVEIAGGDGRPLGARFEATASTGGEVLIFLEDLADVQARAQQLKLASLGRLTASIAHEIRNPLAAISHAGELLREASPPEVQARLLRILGDNVGRLDRIVQDVLELGRRDRARGDIIELGEFLADFIDGFAAAEGVSPDVFALECEGGPQLQFDRAHLRQVLWNLLSNARRHARCLPGSIRLVCGRSGERVELHVVDDGPGIAEDVRSQIFEPFFTTDAKGTGLGLFIARDLCEANGARLELGDCASQGHFVIVGRALA